MKKLKILSFAIILALVTAFIPTNIAVNANEVIGQQNTVSAVNSDAYQEGVDGRLYSNWKSIIPASILNSVDYLRFDNKTTQSDKRDDLGYVIGDNITVHLNDEFSYKIIMTIYVDTPDGEIYAPVNSQELFQNLSGVQQMFFNAFNTSEVTSMFGMFDGCRLLSSADVSTFDTSNVVSMRRMFRYTEKLSVINVSNFDTRNVNDMAAMFQDAHAVSVLDVSNFDTTKVTEMALMFHDCRKLVELDLSGWSTANVIGYTSMHNMFENCFLIEKLDLSSFNTNTVEATFNMFANMTSLKYLDFSNANLENVTNMNYMLSNTPKLQVFKTPYKLPTNITMYLSSGMTLTTLQNASYTNLKQTDLVSGSLVLLNSDAVVIAFRDYQDTIADPEPIYTYHTNNKINVVLPEPQVPEGTDLDLFFYNWEINSKSYFPNKTVEIDTTNYKTLSARAWWNNNKIDTNISGAGDVSIIDGSFNPVTTLEIGNTYSLTSTAPAVGTFVGFQYEKSAGVWETLQGHTVNTNGGVSTYSLETNFLTNDFIRQNLSVNASDNFEANFRALYLDAANTLEINNIGNNGRVFVNNALVGSESVLYTTGEKINLSVIANDHYELANIKVTQGATETNFSSGADLASSSIVMQQGTVIDVTYNVINYTLNVTAKTTNNVAIANADAYTTIAPTTSISADSLSVSGYTALTANNTSEYVFVKWAYVDGADIDFEKVLNTNLNLNKANTTDNTIGVVAVFERRYELRVSSTDNEEFTITYVDQNNQEVTTSAAVTQSVMVFEDRQATINVTKHVLGEQISIFDSIGFLSNDVTGDVITVRELSDKNLDYKNIVIAFAALDYAVVVKSVDENGFELNLPNNYLIQATSGDLNVVKAVDIISLTLTENQPDSKDYVFNQVYVYNDQGERQLNLTDGVQYDTELSNLLDYTKPVGYVNTLTIYIEYTRQAGISLNIINGDNNEMGNVELQMFNGSEYQNVDLLAKNTFAFGTMFRIKSTVANKYYSVDPVEGVIGTVNDGWTEFSLDSLTLNLLVKFEAIEYSLVSLLSGQTDAMLTSSVSSVKIGDTVTLVYEPKSTYEVLTWELDGTNMTRSGNTITFNITEQFLDKYVLNGNVLTLDSKIETIMNRGVFYGLIFGSIGFVGVAILVILLVIRSKKHKAEQAAIQAKLDAVSKKFNISNVISELKQEAASKEVKTKTKDTKKDDKK